MIDQTVLNAVIIVGPYILFIVLIIILLCYFVTRDNLQNLPVYAWGYQWGELPLANYPEAIKPIPGCQYCRPSFATK